jgi:hypothetical protein
VTSTCGHGIVMVESAKISGLVRKVGNVNEICGVHGEGSPCTCHRRYCCMYSARWAQKVEEAYSFESGIHLPSYTVS